MRVCECGRECSETWCVGVSYSTQLLTMVECTPVCVCVCVCACEGGVGG